jgi:hypothetical protein
MGQKSLQGMKFVTLIMLEQAHPEICIAFHGELKSWDGLKSHKLSATDEDAKVQVVVGLRWLDVFLKRPSPITAHQTSTTPRLTCEVGMPPAAIE